MTEASSFNPPRVRARLLVDGGQVRVGVESAGDGDLVQLTPLLRSNLHRLLTVSDLMQVQHQCCMAALLMLNQSNGLWAVWIPPQRCRAGEASFSIEDCMTASETPVTYVVAGSFQTVRVAEGGSIEPFLPVMDGLHIVRRLGADETLSFRLVVEGLVRPVAQHAVVVDDFIAMLQEASPRMTVEGT